MIKPKSKHLDLARLLLNGDGLTARQITAATKLKNPRRAIHYLRESGLKIDSVEVASTQKNWRRRFVAVKYVIEK